MRIVPINILTQVGQRAERGAGRRENSAVEWVLESVIWSQVVILRGDERCGAGKAVLSSSNKRGLGKPPKAAADN